MKLLPLASEARAQTGFTHKIEITHADLTAAATTETLALFPQTGTFPAGTACQRVGFSLKTPFDGGATSTMTLQVGDGGDVDRLLPAVVVHEDGSEIDFGITNLDHVYLAADTIDALFTATGANVSVLTAGAIDIFLAIVDLNDLETPI